MAIPDGKPATDFSAMNREWVRAVAEEAGGGIPAPENPSDGDVLTYSSTDSAWVAAAPGGGGGGDGAIIYNSNNIVYNNDGTATITVARGGPNDAIATVQNLIDDLATGPVYFKMSQITVTDDQSDPSDPYYVFLWGYVPLEVIKISEGIGSGATEAYRAEGYGNKWGILLSSDNLSLSDNIVLTLTQNEF